jgi:lipopolysaccharide transport system permease protein
MKPSVITHQPLSVASTLREAWDLRRVWWFTATARTRARFARTVFGSFWLGFSNLLSIAVLALVYGTVFKVTDFNAYVVYLGLGLVTWNSIAAAVGTAPSLFEHNAQHVHNTNLNPIFYTLEEWAFQVQTFFQSFVLVILALSFFQSSLIPHLLIAGWLPILNLLLFLWWLPVIVCLLGARYRDLYQLVPIILQLIFLLSPILYEKKSLGALSWTADLNPLYHVLSSLRHSLIYGTILGWQDCLLLVVNLLGIYGATRLINRDRRHLPFLI